MTNASVKPSLARIEGKLDEIDKTMKQLSNTEKTETEKNGPTNETTKNPDCDCPTEEVKPEQQQEKIEPSDSDDR